MIQIDDLNESHIPSIVKIEEASRPSPWSESQFRRELTNANSFPKIARNRDELIGYLIPWHIADELHIQNIAVASHHRGQGIGELMLNLAISNALAHGCQTAILEVRESNRPAIQLYKKYRFQIVGKRPAYYRDGENALLMTLPPFESDTDLTAYQTLIKNLAKTLGERLKFTV